MRPISRPTNQPLPKTSGCADAQTSPPVNKVPGIYGQPITKLGVGTDGSGTVTFAMHGETHPFDNTLDVSLTYGPGIGKYNVRVNDQAVATVEEDMGHQGHVKTKPLYAPAPGRQCTDLLDIAADYRKITESEALELISCLTNGLKYLDANPGLEQCRQMFNTKGYGPNPSGCLITRS